MSNTTSIIYANITLRWQGSIVPILILAAIGYAVFIYWREGILSLSRRILLGSLRTLSLLIIIFLLLDPVLGFNDTMERHKSLFLLVDVSESMNTHDKRQSQNDLREAAWAMGKIKSSQASKPLSSKIETEVSNVSRIELAKNMLDLPSFQNLTSEYNINYFCFGEGIDSTTQEGMESIEAKDRITQLGTAITETASRYTGQPIAGMVLLTDGASNEGLDPLSVARQMGEQDIPLYPVGIGLSGLPDIQLSNLLIQNVVFCKDKEPGRIQILSNGYSGKEIKLTLSFDGKEVFSRNVTLTGDSQFEEFDFVPEKVGWGELAANISSLPGEISSGNNRLSRKIRVIDNKAKILYIERAPRWEYRYLRWALMRDRRSEVKFLLTEGEPELARSSDQHLTEFPKNRSELFRYDLIILGDVSPSYFSSTQLEMIREFVRAQGGSFLMISGNQHAPVSYANTSIAPILPVRVNNGTGLKIDASVYPTVTIAGYDNKTMSLGNSKGQNQKIWSLVKPLYEVPSLDGAKPGAVVLAELSTKDKYLDHYPLITWQRYGRGNSLYVGTDQLWRLRYKNGAKHHTKLWGQMIRFLALSRLLGGNNRIQLMVEQDEVLIGEEVKIFANVLDDSYEPVTVPEYTIRLKRLDPEWSQTMQLKSVPDAPGLYRGSFTPTVSGDYRLETPGNGVAPGEANDQRSANATEFHVEARSMKEQEVTMKAELLKKMAELSGGRYFSIGDLPSLSKSLPKEKQIIAVYKKKELWDLPITLIILVILMGTEWFLRRRYDLV